MNEQQIREWADKRYAAYAQPRDSGWAVFGKLCAVVIVIWCVVVGITALNQIGSTANIKFQRVQDDLRVTDKAALLDRPSLQGFTYSEKVQIIEAAEKFDRAVKELQRQRGF